MIKIKKFFEMNHNFDYEKVLKLLRGNYGWGMGSMINVEDFEDNEEYFKNPSNEDEYVDQFHSYLTDLKHGELRDKFRNRTSLRVGEWQRGVRVIRPTSIYNKFI